MKKNLKELSQKKRSELEKEASDLRTEIGKGRLEEATNQAKDKNIISKKKKRLAQVLTVINREILKEKIKNINKS